jgi:hypothetical protein
VNIPQPPIREPINGPLQVGWLAYFTQLTQLLSTVYTTIKANKVTVKANTGSPVTLDVVSGHVLVLPNASNSFVNVSALTGTIPVLRHDLTLVYVVFP